METAEKNRQVTKAIRETEKGLFVMVNIFLIIALCILALFQPNRQRLFVALAFSMSCAVHSIVSEIWFSDVVYYLSAGVIDAVLFIIFCLFARPTKFIDLMILICGLSVLLNYYGLDIYEQSKPAITYNNSFSCLYLLAIYTFWKRDKGDGNSRINWFRLPYFKFDIVCNSLYKKA